MGKRAKRTEIKWVAFERVYGVYVCPHCKIKVVGDNIGRRVTRFLCGECHNEIIVDNVDKE